MLISLAVIGGTVLVAARLLGTARAPASATEGGGWSVPDDVHARSPHPREGVAEPDESTVDPDAAEESGDVARTTTDKGLALFGSALALNVAALAAPPLALASVVPLALGTMPIMQRGWRLRRDPDRRWVGLVDAIGLGGGVLTGHFFATALGGTLLMIGFKATQASRARSAEQMANVFGELPDRARVERGGATVVVATDDVAVGEAVVVFAGEVIPVDGRVLAGVGAVDQRALTGEAQPVSKVPGDDVLASTLVVSGPLTIETRKSGAETAVIRLHDILTQTDDLLVHYRSRGERLIEQGAGPTVALSALTWPLLGPTSAIAVAYAGFGYHMRVAAPLAAVGYIHQAANRRVLIKDARALELLVEVDVVLFDKTGTLTTDTLEVVAVHPMGSASVERVLAVASAVEVGQSHPIARAIISAAEVRGVSPCEIESHVVESGAGVRARIGGRDVRVGSRRLMAWGDVAVPEDIPTPCPAGAPIFVAIGQTVIGIIEVASRPRPAAANVVRALKGCGIEVAMVTGDRAEPAGEVARLVGIDTVHAEIMPEGKAGLVRALQAEGRRVCFVGDGINDAIALKAADVSISMSEASRAAADAASIVLLDDDLGQLPDLFDLAGRFDRNIDRSALLTVIPGVLCVGGVYALHAGLTGAIMLYNVALAGSVANALGPTITGWRGARVRSIDGQTGA